LDIFLEVLRKSWFLLGEMSPYLLFGFAVAGLLSVFVPAEWTERHLGGRGLRPVLEAALWGVPVPLCSCSVIPVVASMRRHGASRAAATAFLLSSPQTGVDSIAVTYALLGPVFAVFRPIAALVSGVVGGSLVLLFGESNRNDSAELPACTDECCAGDRSRSAVVRAAHYGFVTLPRDLGLSLLAGVLIAGCLAALVPENRWQMYLGGGLVSIVIMMAIGIPLYVCATASVPIAAGLIYLGASPGAALAFLIAGPASNAATLAVIWKVLGRRTALLYLATVAATAVLCGLLLDAVMPLVQGWMPQTAAYSHEMDHGGWWSALWAAALLAVLGSSYWFSSHGRHHEHLTEVS
jgi:uncharacterized protein